MNVTPQCSLHPVTPAPGHLLFLKLSDPPCLQSNLGEWLSAIGLSQYHQLTSFLSLLFRVSNQHQVNLLFTGCHSRPKFGSSRE
uniref:Uncharacterized protein n=1 Tax=Poecilia latipinna TaxID=48699 RepID=A0A3B3VAF2_9TELE